MRTNLFYLRLRRTLLPIDRHGLVALSFGVQVAYLNEAVSTYLANETNEVIFESPNNT